MMTKITVRGLWAHKRRLIGSFLAVFLGVAFLCGTLVLSDTLRSSVDRFFTQAYARTDVVVRNATQATDDMSAPRGAIPWSTLATVRQVSGVANAEPVIQGVGQVLDKNGKQVKIQGSRVAGNWISDPALNSYHIVDGRAPQSGNEVVIDRALAKKGELKVGDTTAVMTPEKVPVTIVGIAKFGSQDAFGGTSFTAFTTSAAQRYVARSPDRLTQVVVRAAPGVSQDELAGRVRAAGLPPTVEAITGERLAEENSSSVDNGFVSIFRTFLLVFAGVALLVGGFSINNTFSIILAQRTRESALLRAVGASRRQILASVVVEALALSLVGSVVGLFGGLGVAALLKLMFAAFGFGLPADGLVFTVTTAVVSLLVGVGVTLPACTIPAVRASRVPPIAALRDMAVEGIAVSRRRAATAAVLGVLGIGAVIASAFTGGKGAMPLAGLGAVITIVAMVVAGPITAGPTAAVLGAPMARIRGITGSLARENARRNPRRTSGAANALMIGVGVVTLLTVMIASLKTAFSDEAAKAFGGDLTISAGQNSHAGFGSQLTADVAKVPQVRSAIGLGTESLLIDGKRQKATVTDPRRLADVLRLDMTAGGLAGLRADQIAVDTNTADGTKWRTESQVSVKFPDGATQVFTVTAIYKPSQVAGGLIMSRSVVAAHDPTALDSTVLIKLKDGGDLAAAKSAINPIARAYGAQDVQDRAEFIKAQASMMDQLLGMVYVMLTLAIIIALLGIANTLSLSVYERTRELGLLRAVGTTRSQLRSVVRWESVIVAAFGTVGGLILGLFLGWALVRAAAKAGTGTGAFSAPVAQLVIIVLIGAVTGVLASVRPARRAARLKVLDAIVSP